jgi:glycine/D-amino acid oxidase-like deaminating enzyme
MIYESIIVGRGLIGSAAAKYISRSQKNVALIGPDEATTSQQQIVFASHYDQARIQRIVGNDAVTTLLNQQSANEYASLEKESNISFHTKEGCLIVIPNDADTYLRHYEEEAKKFQVNYCLFESADSLKTFNPDFNFPISAKAIYEPSPCGHINPRLLVKAQQQVFIKNGGDIFNNTVIDVSYENGIVKITCLDDESFYAKKVLLAAGSFTNFFNLLKEKLVLKLKGETTIWAKVNDTEAKRLQSLPSLLYKIDDPEIQDIYLIQPVKYPDGNYYIKIGANIPSDIYFNDLNEIKQWFKNGTGTNNVPLLQKALQAIIPELLIEDCFEKRCIVCYTKHGKPYIGPVGNKGLYIAAGGNGYAAMSSDALGKLAATVLSEDKIPAGFSFKDFEPVFEPQED